MHASFNAIKKRKAVFAVVESATAGISFALLVIGAIMLGVKLNGASIAIGYYFLIGFFAAAVPAGALLVLLLPNDKKLARSLDQKYGLGERMQTMLEYIDSDDEMAVVQRLDAEKKLENIPPEKTGISVWVRRAATAIVALALFVTAIALPKKIVKADAAEAEAIITMTEDQKQMLNGLAADIRGSMLDGELKAMEAEAIDGLIEGLGKEHTESYRLALLNATVVSIDGMSADAMSYKPFVAALSGAERDIALGIEDSIFAYSTGSMNLSGYAAVEQKYALMSDTVSLILDGYFGKARDSLSVTVESGLSDVLDKRLTLLSAALDKLNDHRKSEYYTLLASLNDGIYEVYDNVLTGGYGDSALQSGLDAAFKAYRNGMIPVLVSDSSVRLMDEYIRARLAGIFGYGADIFPPLDGKTLSKGDSGNTASGPEDVSSEEGGYGEGEIIYGSNALVLDPDTGELVPYGTLLEKYWAKLLDRLGDAGISEEMKAFLNEYFSMLNSGIEEK